MTKHRFLTCVAVVAALVAFATPFLFADGASAVGASPATRALEPRFEPLGRLVGVDQTVALKFEDATLAEVFKQLGDVTSTSFRLEGDFPKARVTGSYDSVSERSTLEWIARKYGVDYEVVDGFTVMVRRRPVPSPPGVPMAGVGDVTNPRMLPEFKVQPVYPEDARADGAEGNVILQVIVGADGTVDHIDVLRESNPRYRFDEAAREAVSRWRYDPATRKEMPLDVVFTVFVEFRLH